MPSLNEFQRKLEDFYQDVTRAKVKERQDYAAYIKSICEYYEKGMSIREISAATGVTPQTVAYWLRKKGISRKTVPPPPENKGEHDA